MENHEPASPPEEQTVEHHSSPFEETTTREGKEEAAAHAPEVQAQIANTQQAPANDAGAVPAGAERGEAEVSGADDAVAVATSEVPAAPNSAVGSRSEGAADAASATEQQAQTELPKKKVTVLSGAEGPTGELAAAPSVDPSYGRAGLAVQPTPPAARGYHGVPYLYRLKDERLHTGNCTVIFYQSAYQQVVEHLSADITREHGGLLLGYEGAMAGSEEMTVYVSKALPAQHTVGTKSRLTFTEDTWAEFADQTESLVGTNLKRVGWYHSHPNFGIFLSPYDLDVCSNFQRQTQVALVYDPIRNEGGFFVRGTEGYDPHGPQGFWEYCDLTPDSIVNWKNAELVSPGAGNLSPGEDLSAVLAGAWDSYDGGTMTNRNMAGAGGGHRGPRIRVETPVGQDKRGETYGMRQDRRTRRERLKMFLQGILFGGALTVLAFAIIFNTHIGRSYIGSSSVDKMLAELKESDRQQTQKIEEISRLLTGNKPFALVPQGGGTPSNQASSDTGVQGNDETREGAAGDTPPESTAPAPRADARRDDGRGRRGRKSARQQRTAAGPRPATQPRARPGNAARTQPAPAATQPPAPSGRPLRPPSGGGTPTPTRPPGGAPLEP